MTKGHIASKCQRYDLKARQSGCRDNSLDYQIGDIALTSVGCTMPQDQQQVRFAGIDYIRLLGGLKSHIEEFSFDSVK